MKDEHIEVPDKNEVLDEEGDLIKCPVCGKSVETFDICHNCEWENSGEYNVDGGAMKMTLEEVIRAYREGKPLY